MGGYTTFSTWMVETVRLGEVGDLVSVLQQLVAVHDLRIRCCGSGFRHRAGDHVISAGLKLDVYFGESLSSGRRMANEALMDCFARHGLEVAALYRGIEGFGIGRRIHTERFPDISTDLPLIAEAIDTRERSSPSCPMCTRSSTRAWSRSSTRCSPSVKTRARPSSRRCRVRWQADGLLRARRAHRGQSGLPRRCRSSATPGRQRRDRPAWSRRYPQRTAPARGTAEPKRQRADGHDRRRAHARPAEGAPGPA